MAQASLDLYILTFNCGRNVVQSDALAEHLLNALPAGTSLPDILVLCLQEIAPIGYAFLGGSFLTPYFNALQNAVKLATKRTKFVNVVTRNVGLTSIMVFAKEDLVPDITGVRVAQVGLGVQEMGNKGAVGVRLDYRSDGQLMPLTFVSAHLAPMEKALDRRNEDYKNIVRRLIFAPEKPGKALATDEQDEDAPLLQGMGETKDAEAYQIYSKTSHLFFAGDLNYRTSARQPTPEDIQRFPQPTKDVDDPRHYSHLLKKDQLQQQLRAGKTLHGLVEEPITFAPTYKYHTTLGEPVTHDGEQPWNWATHRWPSWCDRILFSATDFPTHKVHSYMALPLFSTSDHRPVALSVSVPFEPRHDTELAEVVPFSIDPEWKTRRDAARRKEIVVGILSYLSLTWEGRGLLLASIVGALGGWLILRSMLVG